MRRFQGPVSPALLLNTIDGPVRNYAIRVVGRGLGRGLGDTNAWSLKLKARYQGPADGDCYRPGSKIGPRRDKPNHYMILWAPQVLRLAFALRTEGTV